MCCNPACKGSFWLSDFLPHFPRQNEDAAGLFSWKLILFTFIYFSKMCNEGEGRPSWLFIAGFVGLFVCGLVVCCLWGLLGGRGAWRSPFFYGQISYILLRFCGGEWEVVCYRKSFNATLQAPAPERSPAAPSFESICYCTFQGDHYGHYGQKNSRHLARIQLQESCCLSTALQLVGKLILMIHLPVSGMSFWRSLQCSAIQFCVCKEW